MANNLNISVSNIAVVIAVFDEIKVYRSATETGTFSEVTAIGTRPALVTGQTLYAFTDSTGLTTDWYTVSYFNSSSLVESSQSSPRQADSSTYITVQDIRDTGLDASIANDATVLSYILLNQAFIDRATRQWFQPRSLTVRLDGNNSDTLCLPIPIVDVSAVYLNSNTNAMGVDEYEVYNGRGLPDDRKNPRIKLIRGQLDIFADAFRGARPRRFLKGARNQTIVGRFGYVEADESTPEPIKRALIKLTIEKLLNPPYADPAVTLPSVPPRPTGDIIRETTDGHTIQYAFATFQTQRSGLSGWTYDREVLAVLDLYRAPIGIAVASVHWEV